MRAYPLLLLSCLGLACHRSGVPVPETDPTPPAATETVSFTSATLKLGGLLLRPEGNGPFPAVLYNHGSAPGSSSDTAFAYLAPVFAKQGWVFFMPYRRGQGLSSSAGPYILDEIDKARQTGGPEAAQKTQLWLLQTDQLADQLAARAYLQSLGFVQARRIAVAGNSFGGIEALLGAEQGGYCAAVDAAGAAESWSQSAPLRERMLHAVDNTRVPILFFQAANDYDLTPSRELFDFQHKAGRPAELKVYPAFGSTPADGHSFAYRGVAGWSADVLDFLMRSCPAG